MNNKPQHPFTRKEYHEKNPYFMACTIMLAAAITAFMQGFTHAGHIMLEVILLIAFCTEVDFNKKNRIVDDQRLVEEANEYLKNNRGNG